MNATNFYRIVALVGALMTILAKNPIRCAVGLLSTILGIAGLFLRLNAQFLAAIQLIVAERPDTTIDRLSIVGKRLNLVTIRDAVEHLEVRELPKD